MPIHTQIQTTQYRITVYKIFRHANFKSKPLTNIRYSAFQVTFEKRFATLGAFWRCFRYERELRFLKIYYDIIVSADIKKFFRIKMKGVIPIKKQVIKS